MKKKKPLKKSSAKKTAVKKTIKPKPVRKRVTKRSATKKTVKKAEKNIAYVDVKFVKVMRGETEENGFKLVKVHTAKNIPTSSLLHLNDCVAHRKKFSIDGINPFVIETPIVGEEIFLKDDNTIKEKIKASDKKFWEKITHSWTKHKENKVLKKRKVVLDNKSYLMREIYI